MRRVSFASCVRRNLHRSQVGRRMVSRTYTYPLQTWHQGSPRHSSRTARPPLCPGYIVDIIRHSCSRGLHPGLHPPFLLSRPAWNAARVHRPLQRGRSVLTFVIYCHHLSVDGDEKGVYYDNMECLFFRAVLSETTLPQRLRGLGDLWGASAWTHGHTITWEDA
jgi:hypothetical protein